MKTRVGKITDKRSGDVFSYADELLTLRIGGWKCMESRLIDYCFISAADETSRKSNLNKKMKKKVM